MKHIDRFNSFQLMCKTKFDKLFKQWTSKQKIKQQYVGPYFSYSRHCVFVAKQIARLPKSNSFSHTLLVTLLTITLICCFVCGLIHYESDVTVWKSSVVGVDVQSWVHSHLLFCLWTDPLWIWCYSLEKFNSRGSLCAVLSAVHKAFGWPKFPQLSEWTNFPHATL